ncbi:MAG: Na+/H+ antiporter subunit E [Lachnospiraceae bacterium]|nr:Na+/H+ antiporter subunit E [Lachnospiraceae bacterium]
MYVLLFVIWVVFNGRITLEIALFGLAIAALVYLFICKFLHYSIKKDIAYCKKAGYLIGYFFVLLWEIIKANFTAIPLLLTHKYELEPVIVDFDVELKSEFLRVLLANSITLTPGTITVDVTEKHFKVHCLDKSLAKGLADSVFVKLLKKLDEEGKK